MQIFQNPNFDFIRWKWHAFVLSMLVLVVGLVPLVMKGGLPLGVDFSGGTIVVVRFAQHVGEEAVRQSLDSVAAEKIVQQYGDAADNTLMIRLPQMVGDEEGNNLEQGANAVIAALEESGFGEFEVIGTEIVGPVIGAELQRKGIYATLASLLGIMVYIGFRFQFSFALGAVVAALHDILVTIAFLTFFGYELSLNVVAGLLTITGYSVNDTIVVFDRVRENVRSMRRDLLEQVINRSVNQTLSRTVITSATTALAVLSLLLYGGEVLNSFAFTMLVGIISGTYSTVFIAAAVAILLGGRKQKARSTLPPKIRKPGRKVQVS